jgi:hypothetical protein
MTQITTLPEDSDIKKEVLPAVWLGYRGTFNKFKDDNMASFLTHILQEGRDIPKEKADSLSHDFFESSLHDFCIKHLDRKLAQEDHKKIMIQAQEIIKSGKIQPVEQNDNLIYLLANKVALNAHDVSNHMLSEACFLNQYNALPNEGYEILRRGTSPVLYEDHDFYDKAQKSLKKAAQNAPSDRVYSAFNQWFLRYGNKCIMPFKQYGALIQDMRNFNALIINQAILNHQLKQRHPNTLRRPRPLNPIWRSR